MWIIRAYRDDDELAAEWSLGSVTDDELKRRLAFAPTKLGSTSLGTSEVVALADVSGTRPDPDLHYFLDFDADSQRAARGARELRMSA